MAKSLNQGILTAPRRAHAARIIQFQSRPQVITVPLWKAIIVTVGLCAMIGSYAYSVRPAPEVITRMKTVMVGHPVPACKPPASLRHSRGFNGMQMKLAAAIPASALNFRGK